MIHFQFCLALRLNFHLFAKCFATGLAFTVVSLITTDDATGQDTRNNVSMSLIGPPDQFPQYTLSNPRIMPGRNGDSVLAVDFKLTRPGEVISVEIAIRTGQSGVGERMFSGLSGFGTAGNTYRVRLDEKKLAEVNSQGIEIFAFAEFISTRMGKGATAESFTRFKLSNSVTLGPATERSHTRPANADDLKRVQNWREAKERTADFKAGLPAGYVLFSDVADLTQPGMSLVIFRDQVWQPEVHEFLGKDDWGYAHYRVSADRMETEKIASREAAVKQADLDRHRVDRTAFSASIKMIPDTSLFIPKGFVIANHRNQCVAGMPVKVVGKHFRDHLLFDGFVIDPYSYGKVKVQYTGALWMEKRPIKVEDFALKDVLIADQVLTWIEEGGAKERFAKYLEEGNTVTPMVAAGFTEPVEEAVELQPEMATTDVENAKTTKPESSGVNAGAAMPTAVSSRKLKPYPIKSALMPGTKVVSQEDPIQPGIKLGANYGSKWYPVTVLECHDDGSLRMRWDDYGSSYDCDMARSDMIILEQHLNKLTREAKSPNASPRQWTDISGKFTILARFLELSDDGNVVLQKPGGDEVRLPMNKLCEADQKLANEKFAND